MSATFPRSLAARAVLLVGLLGISIGLIVMGPVAPASAGPAAPQNFELDQPGGTTFGAHSFGDEWANGIETSTGYTILETPTGRWEYASPDSNGKLRPSGHPAHKAPPAGLKKHLRSKGAGNHKTKVPSTTPSVTPARTFMTAKMLRSASIETSYGAPNQSAQNSGSQKTLVILTAFNDQAPQTTAADWNAKFFGASDSVRAFYSEASYGQLDLTPATESSGTANDGIVDWITLPQAHPNTVGATGTANRQLTRDAIMAADPFVNYASFDTNSNGVISTSELHITIIVAGYEASYGTPCGKSVWGHRWVLGFSQDEVIRPDNVNVGYGIPGGGGYTQFGEMHCSSSNPAGTHMATIGIMSHEMGHDLNLPDLYDVNSADGASEGVGAWSVMGGGSWLYSGAGPQGNRPSHPDAWSKSYEGWLTPQQINGSQNDVSVDQASSAADVIRLGNNANGVDWTFNSASGTGEYFLVENRQLTGFDAGLPGCGVLVWHVDESVTSGSAANGDENHPLLKLMQADNLNNLENSNNRGDTGDPFPGSTNNISFTNASSPNSKLYNGNATGFEMRNPGACSSSMAPDFTVPDVTAPTNPTLTASPVANQWSNDNTVTVSGFASAQDETNGSGVDGFSYVWDMSASTIPDAGVDAQETITTLTSAALVDGSSHYLHVRTVDVAGNAASTMHLGPFKIDTTGPSNGALGSTPAANTWSGSSTVTANGLSNASDGAGSGLDGFSYVWDTSATTVPDSTLESQETATSITSPTLVSGSSHYLHVRSFDNAGNGSTTTHLGPFKIDTNAPTTGSLTSSPTAGNWSKVATVTVNGLSGAADGTGSGVDGFSYVWDTSATTTPDATIDAQETATSLTSPSLADGNSHYLHIRTVDSVGNISGATHLGPFFIDNSAPSLGTLSGTPGTNTWSKVATVTVDGLSAASDGAGSGMDGFSYVWDTSPTSTPDATIDAQETATSLTSPSLADGSHYLHVRAIDSAGNISATTHVGPFLIDNGAPSTGTLSGVPAADTWSDSDTVTVGGFAASSDGSGSGVDGFSFVWDTSASTVPDASVDAQETITSLTSATLVEGSSHYLHVRTIDSAGNVSSTTHVGPFKLDRTDPSAPDLTSTSTTGQWINATSVEADGLASAADEAGGSGIDGFSFVWDSSASTVPDGSIDAEESETFLTSSTLTEGIHYLHVRTIDSAGNPSATAHLGPFKIDRADPTIATLTPNPSTGTWSKATTVTVNGLASASDGTGSGIDGFSYVWDTNDSTDPDSSIDVQETATSISTSSLADGSSHYLHVRTIDNAGNPSTTTHVGPFKLDRSDPTKPSLSSLTPTGSWSANTTVEATGLGSASDEVGGSGVEGFSYAWSSSASTVPDTSIEARETATSITSPTLGDGTHYLHVRTIDGAGNGSTTEHLGPFLVDGGAPTLGTLSVTPSVGSWSNASTATVGGLGSAADGSGSGVDGFSYVWNTSAATIPDSTIDAGQTVTSLTSSTLADGSYYLHIRVIDNAGNPSGTTHVGPFKIDRTDPSNPSLSSVTPEDLWSSNETVTIDGLSGAADAGSGLSGFSYEWDSTAATVPNASVDSAASAASIISPSLSDGDHYLHLRTVDAAGNVSATVHMGPFRIDRTAPGVSNPVALQAFSNKKNLALSWDAVTDVSSGLDHYGLDYIGTAYNAPATAAKTFAPATSTTSSTTAPFAATLGTSYCFRVRSLDTVGNESSGTQTCTAIPLDDSKLKRVGSWKSVAGTGIFNDKSFSSSKVVGSKLSLGGAVNAKRLAVVATKCSTCGSIRVTFNGVAIRLAGTKSTTISLRSTKTKKNSVILLNPFPKLKSGTVVIKVLTSGKPVNIEGLGISRF